jgi:hypothetical protein
LSFFLLTCADFATLPKKRKTYGRFLGTIFFEGVWRTLVVAMQWVATQKIPKKRKNAKKSVKYFSRNPCLAAKMGSFAPCFTRPVRKLLPLCGLDSKFSNLVQSSLSK